MTDATIIADDLTLHDDVGSFGSYISHGLGGSLDALTGFAPLPRYRS